MAKISEKSQKPVVNATVFKKAEDNFLVKITFNTKIAWLSYEELDSPIADKFSKIRDALGKQKSKAIDLILTLSEFPNSTIEINSKEFWDFSNIKVVDYDFA